MNHQPETATRLPGYQYIDVLEESENSIVHRGIRLVDQKPVILKQSGQHETNLEQFNRLEYEFQIIRSLEGPNLIKVYSLERVDHHSILVLEDIQGLNLYQLISQNPLSFGEKLKVFIEVARQLQQIHSCRVIHRDISPGNIIVNRQTGRVQLVDFSIAGRLSAARIKPGGRLEGTLAYISPEQTGRTGRMVDTRSDLYSLGATMYHIFTGNLPFAESDPMRLVHCHLARFPKPPNTIKASLPPIISQIITRLLEKNAEDRYQSALGLLADLELCLATLTNDDQIPNFTPGQQDRFREFRLTEKLYGREHERAELMKALEKTSAGAIHLMLLSGPSGSGKTALIRQIHGPLSARGGFYIAGKSDMQHRNIPFGPIIQAFRMLAHYLPGEPPHRLEKFRSRLKVRLGDKMSLIQQLIPELKWLLPEARTVAELPAAESENRLRLVFRELFTLFSGREHPLVLFLDDMQWIDPASTRLIEDLPLDPNLEGLFILGSYRQGEVSEAHPLMRLIDEMRQSRAEINQVTLSPLSENNVVEIITDTIGRQDEKVQDLAHRIHRKTAGNPLHINEYLQKLHATRLLWFNENDGLWHWDQVGIEADVSDEDLLDLIAAKISALPRFTRQVLRLGACLGHQFSLHQLALVTDMNPATCLKHLGAALSEGLIIALEPLDPLQLTSTLPEDFNPLFEFPHDEIQQSCYSLMPEARRRKTHLNIGRHLLAQDPHPEEQLFEVTNHLNLGLTFIEDPDEQERLIHLNLAASRKARRAGAYPTALDYLGVAIQLLPRLSWQTHYELTLACFVERASCEQLCGNHGKAAELFELAICQARTVLEMVAVYQERIAIYTQIGMFAEAIEAGLTGLDLLEMSVPDQNDQLHENLEKLRIEIEQLVGRKKIADIADLPAMQDDVVVQTQRLLVHTWAPALNMNRNLMNLAGLQIAQLSLKHGISHISPCGFASYGMFLGEELGDWARGLEFGHLAVELSRRMQNNELTCRVHFLFGAFISPWCLHLKEALPFLRQSYLAANDSGNPMWASFAAFHTMIIRMMKGDQLNSVYRDCQKYHGFLMGIREEQGQAALKVSLRLIEMLEHPEDTRWSADFDDSRFLETIQRKLYIVTLVHYYHTRLQLALLTGHFKEAIAMGQRAAQLDAYRFAWPVRIDTAFYLGLACTRALVGATPQEIKAQLPAIKKLRDQIQKAEQYCPANFRCRRLLLDAEIFRLQNKDMLACDCYDQAINEAVISEMLHIEALACELAGRFYIGRNKPRVASVYLEDACFRYAQWGANTLVSRLRSDFPSVLQVRRNGLYDHQPPQTTRRTDVVQSLDVATFIKASQAITREIQLEPLLEKLLRFSLENAGGRRGFLILEQEGELSIEADADAERDPLTRIHKTGLSEQLLAIGLVNYVFHSGEALVLGNAAREGHFTNDPYVLAHHPKSLLCLPLIYQGKKSGVLYLENNIVADTFTDERLEVLKLLATDAAGAIENARLYHNLADAGRKLQLSYQELELQNRSLEERVASRTRELTAKNQQLEVTLERLRAMQQRIIQQEKLASLGSLTAGIAHEIRNPLNFVNNFSEVSIELLDELRHEIKQGIVAGENRPAILEVIGYLEHNLTRINDHGRRAGAIVHNMLRHSHPKNISDLEAGNLNSLVEEFVSLAYQGYKARFPNFTIDLVVQCEQGLPLVPMIRQDLSRVLINLMENACDTLRSKKERTPGFQGQILVTTSHQGEMICLSIQDNGEGIPRSILGQVFTPFFTTKATGEGTGLGLSLSHDIMVTVHGGRIEIDSEEGEFTRLDLYLPLCHLPE